MVLSLARRSYGVEAAFTRQRTHCWSGISSETSTKKSPIVPSSPILPMVSSGDTNTQTLCTTEAPLPSPPMPQKVSSGDTPLNVSPITKAPLPPPPMPLMVSSGDSPANVLPSLSKLQAESWLFLFWF